jgi:hypothetical protein
VKFKEIKVGDTVICIDDDSSDEDLGMSGIVLSGRRDLVVGKEYIVESVDYRHVPTDFSAWKKSEIPYIKHCWTQMMLKGINKPVFGSGFKKKI